MWLDAFYGCICMDAFDVHCYVFLFNMYGKNFCSEVTKYIIR